MTAINPRTATIANGTSLSDAVNIENQNMFAIIMPAAWTAAALTFQGSIDGTNFFNLYDDTGTEISFTVAASRYVLIRWPAMFFGLKKLKIRSGTASVAVNQAAERALTVIIIPDA